MLKKDLYIVVLTILLGLIHHGALSQIQLPRLISDNLILQRDVELKLTGWAAKNEEVKLLFKNEVYNTVTNEYGEWILNLPPQSAGGPYSMVFQASNTIKIENVLVGDVFLCSGQSNMELPMSRVSDAYPEELKTANNPNIRQFIVPDNYDFNEAHKDLQDGSWKELNPQTVTEFSAVAYFFAKSIYKSTHVPIGIINAAVGGSPVSSWLDPESLKEFPELYKEHLKWKDSKFLDSVSINDKKAIQKWYTHLDEADKGLQEQWFTSVYHKDLWDSVVLPDLITERGFNHKAGVVWLSKKIKLESLPHNEFSELNLGRLIDMDQVYVNGQKIGETTYQYPPRKYKVPTKLLKKGENEIIVRLINNGGEAGFVKDKPYYLIVNKDSINLSGNWSFKHATSAPNTPQQTFIRWKPGGLYNAMIAPLTNFNIKAVVWYQGESDTGNPSLYSKTFPKLINAWRAHWEMPELPFLYVQLSNYMEESTTPQESKWAELREVQRQVNNLVPSTGMAVTIDVGEWNDIHPLNKKAVGDRLALQARQIVYGEDLNCISPQPKSANLQGSSVIIEFENLDCGWLLNKGNSPTGFTISEDGKNFVNAKVEIEENLNLRVYHQNISHPKVVRYAWANNPGDANLFNRDKLPAVPFQIKFN